MKMILRRKDNTSICCPTLNKQPLSLAGKARVIEATVALTLIVVGLFIIIRAL